MRNTLGKEEKLKSKKLIEQLFAEGNRIKNYPLQMVFKRLDHQAEFPIKIAFSVPKRTTRLAVSRIKIKRLMREVYRRNKYSLFEKVGNQYIMMLIYTSPDKINYAEMELYIKELGTKFVNKIQNEKT
jgi:ribonuclease P protein component